MKKIQCYFVVIILLGLFGVSNSVVIRAAEKSERPNVLFLLSDDQRPDTIGALGNNMIKTPNLDQLVKTGMTFTRATCANPICTPSRAEILTGMNSFRNGVLYFGEKFNSGISFWPTTMQQAGYRTGYVGKWHNHGRPHLRGYSESHGLFSGGGKITRNIPLTFPFDQNGKAVSGYRGWAFQTSKNRKVFPEKGVGLTPDISEKFADAAISFLKTKTKQPFFLHVNFTSPHDPLLMPPGYAEMYNPDEIPVPKNFMPEHPFDHGNLKGRDEALLPWPRTKKDIRKELATYYAVISYMDAQIGRILDYLQQTGQLRNTIVIFSSDHGLGVGSHGLRGKQSMYEHTIGVPLIIAGPGIKPGIKTNTQCYLRDLFPTVCEMTGIKIPPSVDGKSLLPAIQGNKKRVHPAIFGYYRNYQRMIRTEKWKLIYYPHLDRSQLFHISADPNELLDLSKNPQYESVMKDLKNKLLRWQKSMNDPALKI